MQVRKELCWLVMGALALAGCRKHEFEPPSREERVAAAEARFGPATFDSIRWPADTSRLSVGNAVYAARCNKCHGYLGEGGTEYVRAQGITVPSLVEPDWPLARDRQGIRHVIFTGHAEGMPTWGVAGISPREIDAVAAYLLERLRPDAAAERARHANAR